MRLKSTFCVALGLLAVATVWFVAHPSAQSNAQPDDGVTEAQLPQAEPDIPLEASAPLYLGLAPVPNYDDYRKGWPGEEK
jgi:hypothetical protein